jgi:hypothetical protein
MQVAENDDIRNVAETVLNSALASAEYGGAGDITTYGNPAGRTLLEERHDMKELMKRLDTQQMKMETQITDLQHRVGDLQHRVKILTQSSEGYRKIRRRFLEVYRRDILGEADSQGLQRIGDGNQAAHNGDAVADASLYKSGEKYHEKVLVNLYGLTADQILYLGKYSNFTF